MTSHASMKSSIANLRKNIQMSLVLRDTLDYRVKLMLTRAAMMRMLDS